MNFSMHEEIVGLKYTVVYGCDFSPPLLTYCCSLALVFLKSKEQMYWLTQHGGPGSLGD